jgi:hypothetical protein
MATNTHCDGKESSTKAAKNRQQKKKCWRKPYNRETMGTMFSMLSVPRTYNSEERMLPKHYNRKFSVAKENNWSRDDHQQVWRQQPLIKPDSDWFWK